MRDIIKTQATQIKILKKNTHKNEKK